MHMKFSFSHTAQALDVRSPYAASAANPYFRQGGRVHKHAGIVCSAYSSPAANNKKYKPIFAWYGSTDRAWFTSKV